MNGEKYIKITRLYAGADGESHFEDIEISLDNKDACGHLSHLINARGMILRETVSDFNFGWHTVPQRLYVIGLEGEVDIEVGDGSKRVFKPGDVLLAEDTTGRGQVSRSLNNQPRRSLVITLD